MSAARAVAAAMDPVMSAAGFAEAQFGQVGWAPEREVGMTFCAAFSDFRCRFPWLPQSADVTASCIDLTIDLDAAGRIGRLDLEGWSVEQTLRDIGRVHDSVHAGAVIGTDAFQAIPALLRAVDALFRPVTDDAMPTS